MKLYGFPSSPNTWKVRAVAAHLELPLEFELVDLTKGQQRSPAYLALNPTGRTPALADGDFILWESNAILQYLASLTANTLWPNDARVRADIMRWQSWQLAHWSKEGCEPLIFERLVKSVLRLGPPDAAVVAKGTEAFNRYALILDAHLAKSAYLVGATITLADFSVAAPLFCVKEAELPVGAYPHVQEWFARVSALPAWRDTAPVRASAAA
ncbi:MAG TPA: glutathione S-transferase family protein [Xanthobacteraceae bacterium]|nr:glutathione S-transferase family protein [Xanthobacteraceae bacterium]